MKKFYLKATLATFLMLSLLSCGNENHEKGFAVASIEKEEEPKSGIAQDSIGLPTRPGRVLLTGNPKYRLTTIFKVNFRKDSTTFTGDHDFHFYYGGFSDLEGNAWHGNYLPGIEAVYGFNLINIAHFDATTQTRKMFFEKHVLVKTLYFPSYSKDTLNYQPVNRNYFMVSVFDEDTNKDGYINPGDLRRFYSFDIDASNKQEIVPKNYSVFKSEYDPAGDRMLVFAKLDLNGDGKVEELEPIHIFWVDLKDPKRTGRMY